MCEALEWVLTTCPDCEPSVTGTSVHGTPTSLPADRELLVETRSRLPSRQGPLMAAIEHGRDTVATRMPVIARTANALVGDHAQCLTAGTDDDLSKRFMAAQLDELLAH